MLCVVGKKQIFRIGYYKKQSFATKKNVVHDEKDLAQARSLSLWTRKQIVSREKCSS
jgi:HJR/Mrr/RecB family endonuclease